ncbi:hypothetical protein [Massilia pseudoviolaceinigra]|uniref:hypothetical protein n=1 Tax=Massilia pseudoviolaceinigra TaxID=3057165 RepID=UPI0027966271|nr:hypothetical protein [Massilia sp. CCM 9206]MDQ1919335.1 hypothetical protein [Massilia sp. CCM 9206]
MNVSILFAKKALVSLLAGFLLLQGCASTANNNVLAYSSHDFGLLCFGGVSNVRLTYAGAPHKLFHGKGDAAPEKKTADATRIPGFLSGSYRTFAGPIDMQWRSRDGSELSHVIDLNKEVTGRHIPYDQPERVYAKKPFVVHPTIIVEFNDRTVNVYLAATLQVIPLDPAKRTYDHVESRTLVYSKTL